MKKQNITSLLRIAMALGGLTGAALTQAQPVINGITPDGTMLFQSSDKLSFNATATAGIGNLSVQLNGKKLDGSTFLKVYSTGNGLTFDGQKASVPLSSNVMYSASIVATDVNGASATSSVTFDTIIPAYTFEVEDYDYNNGKFFDNPQTNAYRNLAAVDGVDAHNASGGNQDYRPHEPTSGGLATETCGDKTRIQYTTGQTDYDVGWNNNGNWANYTRHFPTGTYNIYIRASNPGGDQTDNAEISGPINGRFAIPGTGGWQNYTFVPLVDTDGNLVEFVCDNSLQTLTVTTKGGNYNANFFMLMPVASNPGTTSDAIIDSIYPNGSFQFQNTNNLTFAVTSTLGVNTADIAVQLGVTNLAGKGTNTLLLPGNGLTATGSSKSWTITTPLSSNLFYTAFIQVTDANGIMASTNITFDTLIPAFTWEAEDWNYYGGESFADWTPNCYMGYDGVDQVDFSRPSTGGGNAYAREGLSTEVASDIPRLAFDGYQDYDIGNNGAGNWVNYTRTLPSGIFNLYIRIANGNTATTKAGTISVVTSGATTDTQSVMDLGTYDSPYTGGWQKYVWQPVRDAGGNLVRITGGTTLTLRHTVVGGNANQGFYMLVPADLSVHTLPYVSGATPDGTKMFTPTNLFHFTVNSAAGIKTNNIIVTLDGVVLPRLALSGTPNMWNATLPVTLNAYHTVNVKLTDDYGTTTSSYAFATFNQDTAYFFEAEDYDYEGGNFIDPPLVNGYAGLEAYTNVDASTVSGNFDGTHVAYRPSGLNQENASDVFVAPNRDGAQNYDLGNTAAGNWGNYTRNFPAGTYNIYMRAANGNTTDSSGGSMQIVTAGLGTTSQTTQALGTFDNVPATGGWQVYTWVALRDSNGKLAEFAGGSKKTLRAICGGGQNNDYYVLVPADSSAPTITGLYPNGTSLFQQTNKLTFTVSSPVGINTNDIQVVLNGVTVTNLSFTGSSTSWTITTSLKSDSAYAANISFVTLSGSVGYKSFAFDTFSSAYYTFEAEDYDYDNGKFFDNPQTNAYITFAAVDGVDAHNASGGNADYRPHDTTSGGLATESTSDTVRTAYTTGLKDYDVGWNNGGNWANYTRHFPVGSYNIYMRGANPNTAGTDSAEISGPVNGRFAVPNTGGWQIYTFVPLTDADGNLVTFDATGAVQTLKVSTVGGSYNANFYMLVPAASKPMLSVSMTGNTVTLAFPTQSGSSYQVLYKNSLTDTSWTALGSAVSGSGNVQSVTDTIGNNCRFYRLQATVKP